MQELDIQTLSVVIAAVSIVIGVIMGILSIRNLALSRKASLFTDFQGQAYDMEFMKALLEINTEWSWNNMEEFFKKYGPETNFDAFAKFSAIGSYFDGMGKLLRLKLIDAKHIPELMAVSIIEFWEKIGPISNEIAVILRRPEAFSDIKYLYDAIHKLELPGQPYE
ncbi:MAG: DUF4760 domain-containing protein [Candidatus Thorarchaeota archaeon]